MALDDAEETEQADIGAAWDETIQRRLDELMSGKVKPVSGRETHAIARTRLAERGKSS